jgi:hypothetical protein
MGRRFEIWSAEAHAEQAGKDLSYAREHKAALRRPRRREGA